MPDEMFFTKDARALVRGNRIAQRTDTCRPCLLRAKDQSQAIQGVIMDASPYGLLVRTLSALPVGSEVSIQLMRDEAFRKAYSTMHQGAVVRQITIGDGFTDHGIRLIIRPIPKASERPVTIDDRTSLSTSTPPRMHTIDFTVRGRDRGF